MLTYKTLEGITSDTLYKTYDEAFVDYPVDLGFDEAKLMKCLDRRGCENNVSYGAFDGDRLVGFVSNAVRLFDGEKTAYDALTGVSFSHRKIGAGKGMMLASCEHFRKMGIRRYLLECIQTNESAYALYKSVGFTHVRDFQCYSLPAKTHIPVAHDVRITEDIDDAMWDKLTSFWDCSPSWQNSVLSVKAMQGDFLFVIAYEHDEPVGYAVVDKNSCNIAQIAVSKNHRRRGIGTSILGAAAENTPSKGMSLTNADGSCTALGAFLRHYGFRLTVEQFEMELKL